MKAVNVATTVCGFFYFTNIGAVITLDYTISEIYRLAAQYKDDTAKYNLRTVEEIFEFTKNIPYRTDLNSCDALECLKRPMYGVVEGDCDDKVIFAGAALTRIGIPWRVVTVSYRIDKKIHHVYIEVFIHGRWLPFDATYQINKLFYEKPFTEKIIWSNPMRNYNNAYIPLGEESSWIEKIPVVGSIISGVVSVWSAVKGLFKSSSPPNVFLQYEKAHAQAVDLKTQILNLYAIMDVEGKNLMSEWAGKYFNDVTSVIGKEAPKAMELITEQVSGGSSWWNDQQSRIGFQCSYPLEAVLVRVQLNGNFLEGAVNNWVMNPLISTVITPCQDYIKRKSLGTGSGFLSTPIIPGVDNLLLFAGAGAALFFFTRKKGRR